MDIDPMDLDLALFSLRLLQASLASLLAGVLTWLLMRAALRRWPVLASRRLAWLAPQFLIAAVFLLSLPPRGAALTVLPALSLPRTQAVTLAVLETDTALAAPSRPAADAAPAPAAASGLAAALGAWLPRLWLLLYPAGLLWTLLSVLRARRLLARLLATSVVLSARDVAEHGGITDIQAAALARHGIAVRETPAAVSPMLLGLIKPCLLLPAHLRGFDPEQQRLIVEHELTHWRRRDPLWLAMARLLQALLWFNPVPKRLAQRLGWAQELGCDRQVLAGRPQGQRRLYAAALLRQLSTQVSAQRPATPFPHPVLAFGGLGGAAMAERIRLMRETAPARLSRTGKALTALALGATAAACLLLQPALAWRLPEAAALPPAQSAEPAASAALAEPAWRYPLERVRVSSFYGVVSRLLPDGHHGIDFIAARGTPVQASAGGIAGIGFDARHGNFVTIDHGPHLRSLYAHLDRIDVRAGQAVAAGQQIGKVGATGMATGPHLHFELYRDGRLADPQSVLAGLDALATRRARDVRQAQMGR